MLYSPGSVGVHSTSAFLISLKPPTSEPVKSNAFHSQLSTLDAAKNRIVVSSQVRSGPRSSNTSTFSIVSSSKMGGIEFPRSSFASSILARLTTSSELEEMTRKSAEMITDSSGSRGPSMKLFQRSFVPSSSSHGISEPRGIITPSG